MRKAYCLISIICFLSSFKSFCQKPRTFKQGVYTSWQEVTENSPKYSLPKDITYKKVRTSNILENEIHRLAVLNVSKEKAEKLGKILAFSNGKDLFLNKKFAKLSSSPYFSVVEMHGNQYGISNNLFAINFNKEIGAGKFPMYCKINGVNIINFKENKISSITSKKDLKKIIASDTELLERFNSEDNQNQVLKLYIIEFLIRNFI